MTVYVGDTSDVVKRIRTNHCSGNVEASALRRSIAKVRNYRLRSVRRPSGSLRTRIDAKDFPKGEADLSSYVRSGTWKYVICNSYDEAHDFQWYVIEMLHPLLNSRRDTWNAAAGGRYRELLRRLEQCAPLHCTELKGKMSGPGVYVFCHDLHPSVSTP
jgi:hypothetical protein